LEELESAVGGFSVDLYATEEGTGRKIIIENQLEDTNHDHLGKIITYASGKGAEVIVWIVKRARDEHRQAVEWLNQHTDSNIGVFLLEIELWQINDSPYAPKFNIVERPNDWAKSVKAVEGVSDTKKLQAEFWQAFAEYAFAKDAFAQQFKKRKAQPQHWYSLALGSSAYHLSFTVNTQKKLIGVETERDDIDGALILKSGIDVGKNKLYNDGLFYVQDLASQKAVSVLSPIPDSRVLDMCAAPGGKSFTMALLMQNKGELVSCDLYPQRVELIEKSAKRLGLDIINPKVCDATAYDNTLGEFDYVLCDVPCSGLGVIRRKPDIKYKDFAEFDSLCEIQLKILENAIKYLKKGGKLLYSTCTLRKKENEDVVNAFLSQNKDFVCEYSHTFMPHIDGTDGFYCALLVNNN